MYAAQFEIQAQCESEWDSGVISGTYKAVGAYGDYAIYEKQTTDATGNWWFFYYDTTRRGWEFGYVGERIIPGVTVMERFVSISNKPGETPNNLN